MYGEIALEYTSQLSIAALRLRLVRGWGLAASPKTNASPSQLASRLGPATYTKPIQISALKGTAMQVGLTVGGIR